MTYLLIIHFLALVLLTMGTFITMSSPSPLIAWLGLELNTLSFIPLMKNKNNTSSHESMIKYFLVQSVTSTLFLTPTLLLHHYTLNLPSFSPLNMIMTVIPSLALLTKLTLTPFHFWLFPLIKSISWLSFILLMTWQKIAPLFLMPHLSSNLITFSIIMSTLIPPIMMMNQNSMKTILGYASITHMSWLLMINFTKIPLLYVYMIIYTMNFLPIFYLLSSLNLNYLTQTTLIPNKYKLLLFFLTLSLSGFPPLMMFMAKITLILQFTQKEFYLLSFLLLSASLIITYTYIHINFPLLLNYPSSPLKSLLNPPTYFFILLFSPLLSIPMMFTFLM